MGNKVNITSCRVSDRQQIELTKFKRFICWLFNILPASTMYVKLVVTVAEWDAIYIRDIIQTREGVSWAVINVSKEGHEVTLANLSGISYFDVIGEAFILSNAAPEK